MGPGGSGFSEVTGRPAGIGGRLRQSLTNTNCTESMISICRTNHGRAKRWRDGEMERRRIAAGMLEAEHSLQRLKSHVDVPNLVIAITNAVNPGATATPANYAQVA
jgi:hypothetical protein